MASEKTYRVNWLIDNIRGKVRNAGDEVTIGDEEAAPLLAVGALSPKKAEPKPEQKQGDGKEGDAKQ